MTDLKLALDIQANVDGQPSIENLQDTVAALGAKIQALQQATATGGKDWLDYAQQATGAAESLANVVSTSEDVLVKTAEIGAAVAVYRKWQTLVEGVRGVYAGLQAIMAASSDAMATTASAGFDALSGNMLKLETRIGSLVARFNAMEALAKGLGLVGLALTVAEIGIAAHQSNEQTRALTEQVGGLSASLQTLDPASKSVQNAKERFEELYKAALALHQEMPDLVGQFKEFFDTTSTGNLTVQQSGRLLTDFLQIQKSLHATTAETEAAQTSLNEAFDSGLTSIPKLGAIFGAALNPALSAVAKSMGITRQQLEQLINTGQLGAETVLPALAAAARTVTAPLQSAGDAADFSKAQFDAMGLSAYDLADKALPGVATALQYTAKEIANTADASVDPIGAAVERIENFGSRIAEWARLTKQSITDAFAGPDIKQALDTGLKEAMFGLDFLLVGLKEEFVAVGESIGVVAGAAATATNPIDDLKAIWSGMADRLLNTRDRLNEYVNALEGADNAQGRTADGARNLSEQLKTLPEIKLPEALQDIVDKLTATQSASEAVGAAWKELGALDFTGGNLRNLLVLRQTIQGVSEKTQDATGTQAAFSAELSKLPVDKLSQLLGKITELGPRLQQAGDDGALLNTVLGAAFDKLGLNAAEAGGKITRAGKDAAATFALIAGSAETNGAQIRAALAGALDASKTQADVALISAEFKKLAESRQASGQLVADGQAAILRRLTELQNQLPGIAAAFKDLGIASSQHLRAIADSARASFDQLKAGGATLQELQQGFLSWAAAEIEAANAAGLPAPAVLRHVAAAMGLTGALGELMRRYRELKPEQDAQVEIAARAAQAGRGYTDALQAVANAQISGLRAEIDLARAKGQTGIAQQKSIELTRLEADWARGLVAVKQQQIEAEQRAIAAEIARLEAARAVNAEDEKARQTQIAGLRLRQQGLELQKSAIATQAEEKAATAELEAQTQTFIAAGYKEIDAKRLALLASGQFTAALKIEEEQRKKTADAAKEQEAADQKAAQAAAQAAAAAEAQAKEQAAALADAEREARRTAPVMAYLAESFGDLNDKGRDALDAIGGDALLKGAGNATRMAQATTDLTRKLDEAAQAEIAFGAEVAALQDVAGGVGEEADRARQKLIEMAFAGAQGIDGITRSGEEAVRALEDIKRATEEAEAALAGLAADFRKQILQIQGDQKALLDLEYQDNLRKLEELSARAGELGRDEYERAKAEAEDLHRLKLKQLKEQDEARNKQNSTATTGGQTAANTPSGNGAGGVTTVNNTFLIDPAKLADEEWVRRNVIPTLDRVSRLRG